MLSVGRVTMSQHLEERGKHNSRIAEQDIKKPERIVKQDPITAVKVANR
jgi:hypothetical protein